VKIFGLHLDRWVVGWHQWGDQWGGAPVGGGGYHSGGNGSLWGAGSSLNARSVGAVAPLVRFVTAPHNQGTVIP